MEYSKHKVLDTSGSLGPYIEISGKVGVTVSGSTKSIKTNLWFSKMYHGGRVGIAKLWNVYI